MSRPCAKKVEVDKFERQLKLEETFQDKSALTNPESIKKSSLDVNRHLYPRPSKKMATTSRNSGPSMGFVSASSVLSPFPASNGEQRLDNKSQHAAETNNFKGNGFLGKRKKNVEQTNKVTRYFKVVNRRSATGEDLVLPSTPPKSTSSSCLYSPIRKLEGSEVIYVSDDSPSSVALDKEGQSRCLPSASKTSNRRLFIEQSSLDATQNVLTKNEPSTVKSGKPLCHRTGLKSKHSDKYGLLGTGQAPKNDKVDWFAALPLDIVENIFCILPNLDLCLNVNRVCRYWESVVSSEKFIPWKKKYHRVKAGSGADLDAVQRLMQQHGLVNYQQFLPQLIRYMAHFKPVTAHNMQDYIQRHPKYPAAVGLFAERFSDLLEDEVPNPWSVITALVIIAESVRDVQLVIHYLSQSDCTAFEVIECLYCVATFLLAFKKMKRDSVWNRLHYQVYYALYLHENKATMTTDQVNSEVFSGPGQQSLLKYSESSKLQMTHEQMRIVNHRGGLDDVVKIVAFAGTGKTTTLIRYTQMRPAKKFLLVMYNKSVCEVAKNKFPHNVVCKTGHGLSFAPVGRRYQHKFAPNLKVRLIVNNLEPRKGENLYVRAKFVMDTLNTFMASADPFVTTAHAPSRTRDDQNLLRDISFHHREMYAQDAQRIWDRMVDLRDKTVPMVHDGYIKLYQLQKPKLKGYDCILIDEAQDLTPAIADILLSQSQPKILVGDPHQQIYSFRGAVNAMQQIQATHIYYLTQSMRFGPEISFVASSCLEMYKQVETKTLVGNGLPGHIDGEVKGQLAIITRCNFTLFSEAVRECSYTSDQRKSVAFVGGTDGFGFPMIRDIYTLMLPPEERKAKITNGLIAYFHNLGELEKYATKTSDHELLGKIKIVKTYNRQLPTIMNQIEQRVTKHVEFADVVLSTAHKAKGLEFTTVRLTDDFNLEQSTASMINPGLDTLFGAEGNDDNDNDMAELAINSQSVSSEEANLLYVAVTRAKKCLVMNKTLLRMLKLVGETFEFPVLSEGLKERGVAMKCLARGVEFEPCCLSLWKKKIVIDQQRQLESGVYSPEAVSQLYRDVSWRNLLGVQTKTIERT